MGRVVEDVLRIGDRRVEDVEGKVTLLWATVHGLAALTMVGRIEGGQEESRRLAEQAIRDYLTAWRGA